MFSSTKPACNLVGGEGFKALQTTCLHNRVSGLLDKIYFTGKISIKGNIEDRPMVGQKSAF